MMKRQAALAVACLFSLALLSGAQAAGNKLALPLDSKEARLAEATVGDLVADAARAALRADIGLVQASELRSVSVAAGEVKEGELAKALMYPEEQLVLAEMPGSALQAALQRSFSLLPQPNPGFLQVSGLTVAYRSTARANQRLVTVTTGTQPLDPAKSYLVAMPMSLSKGAMGYFRVFENLAIRQQAPSFTIGAALTAYLAANPAISIPPGKRLVDLAVAGK